MTLTGITILPTGSDIAPTIYLDGMEKMTAEEAAQEVLRIYEREKETKIKFQDLMDLMDWNKAKNRVIYNLINMNANLERLREIPHRNFFDLAVIFKIPLETGGENETIASVTIKNWMMKKWGIETRELMEVAKKNTIRDYPAKVAGLQEILTQIYSLNIFPPLELNENMEESMFVITNNEQTYGSASILYPGVASELAERLKCDLILIPSSIHEWIAIKAEVGVDAMSLKELVKDVNKNVVDETEVLSDNIYFYSRKNNWITNGTGDRYHF